MTLHADFVWEVRTTGDDSFGGGYKSSAGTTDYSQQDSAQLSLTDCATSGIGVTTLTSATGGFTAAMVGNSIQLSGGTNLTAGFYEITAHTDTNTVTLDRAPDDGVGGVSGATGKVGGALLSPALAVGQVTNGNIVYVASGTYTISSTTANVANGKIELPASLDVTIIGYNSTRNDLDDTHLNTNNPILQASGVSSFTVVNSLNTSNSMHQTTSHLTVDGNGNASITGFDAAGGAAFFGSKADDVNIGFGNPTNSLRCFGCEAVDCAAEGFHDVVHCFYCVSHGCADGFRADSSCVFVSCLAYENTDDGFVTDDEFTEYVECTSVDNTGDGFTFADRSCRLVNSVSTHNGGYGLNISGSAHLVQGLYTYSNTSGAINNQTNETFNHTVLTADPWVDRSADDYRPNNTAGGGAVLRAAGLNPPGQTNNHDIGATQHADPAGGGGSPQLVDGGLVA